VCFFLFCILDDIFDLIINFCFYFFLSIDLLAIQLVGLFRFQYRFFLVLDHLCLRFLAKRTFGSCPPAGDLAGQHDLSGGTFLYPSVR